MLRSSASPLCIKILSRHIEATAIWQNLIMAEGICGKSANSLTTFRKSKIVFFRGPCYALTKMSLLDIFSALFFVKRSRPTSAGTFSSLVRQQTSLGIDSFFRELLVLKLLKLCTRPSKTSKIDKVDYTFLYRL